MLRQSKRVLSILLTVALAVTMSFTSVAAASTGSSDESSEHKDKKDYLLQIMADDESDEDADDEEEEEREGEHANPQTFMKNMELSVAQKEYSIKRCESVVSVILDDEMSDLEKYYTIAIWLNKNVNYDWHFWSGGYDFDYYSHQWDAYGVLKERNAVCVGIAITYANLCHAADLPCKFVRMDPKVLDHTINYIPDINGSSYYIDVTENIFFMSEEGNPFNPIDIGFSCIKKSQTPSNTCFEYDEGESVKPSTIKDYYYTSFEDWFNEYGLHQDTDKTFSTKYKEKGSGVKASDPDYYHASYSDYPKQFSYTQTPGLWFLEDFYEDPDTISDKILNKEFDEQLLDVSGLANNYDVSSADELEDAVSGDISVDYFPSSKGGKVVAQTANLRNGTDYTVECTEYDAENGKATLTITGAGEYTGTQQVSVKVRSAVVETTPARINSLVYNGKEQALVTAGKAVDGEMVYAVCESGEAEPDADSYSTDIPTAKNARKYDVWYKAVRDGDFHAMDAECVKGVEIARKSLDLDMENEITLKVGESVKLDPQLEADVAVKYEFDCYDDAVTVSEDGTVKAVAEGVADIYVYGEVVEEDPNYEDYVSTSVTVTVVSDGKTVKAANPMKLKGKTVTVKRSKVRKKAQTIKRAKAFTVSKAQGKLSYKLVSAKKGKKSFKKYFKVNAKTGKVTVKKGLRKGTYKVKVKVQAAGNSKYKASGWKTVTFKVRVK